MKLKNAKPFLTGNLDYIECLGVKVPKISLNDLPTGPATELIDLQQRLDSGEIGNGEYLLRMFCLYTEHPAASERVPYRWLSKQHLEPEETTELWRAVGELAQSIRAEVDAALAENKDGGPKKAKRAS